MADQNEPMTRWPRLAGAVPVFRWLPRYDRSRLGGDLVAGAIVGALLIPQSLGYARIAGVPVEVGLYAVPLVQLIPDPASTRAPHWRTTPGAALALHARRGGG